MKTLEHICLLALLWLALSGCKSNLRNGPSAASEPPRLPTPLATSSTYVPNSPPTETRPPSATLVPEEAAKRIEALLQGPVDCAAPCFWGITPGQTTLGEAEGIFEHLGLLVKSTTVDNTEFYGVRYESASGLSFTPILTIPNQIVENLRLQIIPEERQPGIPREWLAYSPETLIGRYGPPSRVDFFAGWGPHPTHSMTMYFDAIDLIVEYGGVDIGGTREVPVLCPLVEQFDSVRVWMGKDPQYPHLPGVSLQDATTLTVNELAQLMAGNPQEACFNLKGEAFP